MNKPETYIVECEYSGVWFPQRVDVPADEANQITRSLEEKGYPVKVTRIGAKTPIYVSKHANVHM